MADVLDRVNDSENQRIEQQQEIRYEQHTGWSRLVMWLLQEIA